MWKKLPYPKASASYVVIALIIGLVVGIVEGNSDPQLPMAGAITKNLLVAAVTAVIAYGPFLFVVMLGIFTLRFLGLMAVSGVKMTADIAEMTGFQVTDKRPNPKATSRE